MGDNGPEAKLEAEVEGAQAWPRLSERDGQDCVNDDSTQEADETWKQAGCQVCSVCCHFVLQTNFYGESMADIAHLLSWGRQGEVSCQRSGPRSEQERIICCPEQHPTACTTAHLSESLRNPAMT